MSKLSGSLHKDSTLIRLLAILVALIALATIFKGTDFLNISTFQSMGKQFPEFGILAIAMAFALYTAGIDLSVVAVANLCAVILAKFMIMNSVMGPNGPEIATGMMILGVLLALGVGAICGIINGLLIGGLGIAPILATLGTHAFFTGTAIVMTNGKTVGGIPHVMADVMNNNVGGVPVPVLIFALIALIAIVVLEKTTLGYKLRMLGTSPRATIFSGFNNVKLYASGYMMSSIFAAVSGLIMLGRFNSAKADYGASYLMSCILIAVLGGMDPNGGKGSMKGVVVAVLIVQVISSWINMYEMISPFYRQIVWGALLLFVLVFNHYEQERARKKAMKG